MMDWLYNQLWLDGHFRWAIVGWIGNAIFSTRFVVQWYATEKKRQVVVPVSFWWLSLAGSLLLLIYAVFSRHDYVFIFAYAFNWAGFIRNLVIHRRHKAAHLDCPACGVICPPNSNFCFACGSRLDTASAPPRN
jgi:lipid-A-disaccharide synthase-like uncharacterized protein